MTVHYSKYALNTHSNTPYFQAQLQDGCLPSGQPLGILMQRCRAFRRLPPNIRRLSALSRVWAERHGWIMNGIDQYYDEEGYELNPLTGKRLTDKQIDAAWEGLDLSLYASAPLEDIPEPTSGFPDPNTWEPPPAEEDESELDPEINEEGILKDVAERGLERAAEEYGVALKGIADGPALAQAILSRGRGSRT